MPKNYLLIYFEQLATEIELLCKMQEFESRDKRAKKSNNLLVVALFD